MTQRPPKTGANAVNKLNQITLLMCFLISLKVTFIKALVEKVNIPYLRFCRRKNGGVFQYDRWIEDEISSESVLVISNSEYGILKL